MQYPFKIPMALSNNNFIGYTFDTIVRYKVRWIEAVAACPAWTSMVCFYIDGDRGHLMEETMFSPQHRVTVRGNVFSFHMDWEKIMESLARSTSDPELAILPHDPEHLAHMVRLHLRVGSVDMAKHIPEIKVRAHVLLALGVDLIKAGHAAYVSSHAEAQSTLVSRMDRAKRALEERIKQRYPLSREEARKAVHSREGEVPGAVLRVVEESCGNQHRMTSRVFEKNATPAEGGSAAHTALRDVAPQSLKLEYTADASLDVNAMRSSALSHYSDQTVQTGNKFMDQQTPLYVARAFPFVFPYQTGGPEYKKRSDSDQRAVHIDASEDPYYESIGVSEVRSCATVSSTEFTTKIVRRAEFQLHAAWDVTPALTNLHWRHTMLRTPSLGATFQHKDADETRLAAREYCEAAKGLYDKLWHGYVLRNGKRRRIDGDIGKLRYAENLSAKERLLLRNMSYIGSKVPGCQEIRIEIGHCLFGARTVYGDGLFMAISPSTRHSGSLDA